MKSAAGPLSATRGPTIESLEQQYRGPLTAYFRRRLSNADETEDLVQDVFLNLSRGIGIPDVTNLNAYVFKVATNLLRDHRRRAKARRVGLHVDVADMLESARIDHGLIEEIEPERVLFGKDRLRRVSTALDELGERTRDVFILCRVERMRQREVADRLGISLSAVEKHLVKAIAFLVMRMGDDDVG